MKGINSYIIIIIILVNIIIGAGIHKNRMEYDKLPKLYTAESFESALKEDIGDCLVQGQLVALDPLEGKYCYVRKNYQSYEAHLKSYTDSDGHAYTRVEYDWETYRREEAYARVWRFYNIELPITALPWVCYLRTDPNGRDHRIEVYGCNYIYNVVIRGEIKNGTINNPKYYFDADIDSLVKSRTSYIGLWLVIVIEIICIMVIKE